MEYETAVFHYKPFPSFSPPVKYAAKKGAFSCSSRFEGESGMPPLSCRDIDEEIVSIFINLIINCIMNKKVLTLCAGFLLAGSLTAFAQYCPTDGEVPYRTRAVYAASLDNVFDQNQS